MVIQEVIELFRKHQKGTVKKSTLKSYGQFLERFQLRFSGYEVTSIFAVDFRLYSAELSRCSGAGLCEQFPLAFIPLPPVVNPEVLPGISPDDLLHLPVHRFRKADHLLLLARVFTGPEGV
jgi:hypothetical protein